MHGEKNDRGGHKAPPPNGIRVKVSHLGQSILAISYSRYRAISASDIDIRDISAGTLTSASGGLVHAVLYTCVSYVHDF